MERTDLVVMASYFFMLNRLSLSYRSLYQILRKGAQFLLGAATTGETRKSDLYGERCRQQDYLFFPVVLESFGGMGVRGRDLIMKIDDEGKLNGVRHIHGMRIKTFLQRAIAFSLQSGNAQLIHGSKRSRKRLD